MNFFAPFVPVPILVPIEAAPTPVFTSWQPNQIRATDIAASVQDVIDSFHFELVNAYRRSLSCALKFYAQSTPDRRAGDMGQAFFSEMDCPDVIFPLPRTRQTYARLSENPRFYAYRDRLTGTMRDDEYEAVLVSVWEEEAKYLHGELKAYANNIQVVTWAIHAPMVENSVSRVSGFTAKCKSAALHLGLELIEPFNDLSNILALKADNVAPAFVHCCKQATPGPV